MPARPDWSALRGPLRACAIAVLALLAFLVFWQLFIPGSSAGFWGWSFILVTSVGVPSGLGLPVAASRRLWRAQRRGWAWVPLAFPLLVLLLPGALAVLGGSLLSQLCAALLGLLLSAALSAYQIVSTPVTDTSPASALDPPVDYNADEPHAYARDVSTQRKLD